MGADHSKDTRPFKDRGKIAQTVTSWEFKTAIEEQVPLSAQEDSLNATMQQDVNPQIQALIDNPRARLHFVGIAGAGMSALADYRLQGGGRVSGSDRYFDRGELTGERDRLLTLGADIVPQDGSGTAQADLVVASTAVEAQIPDLTEARRLGCPVIHRAALLASHVASRNTLAVAGTSGKSTVVGLCFAALEGAGMAPGVITGGELNELKSARWRGNGRAGQGPLIVEADESDKSLTRYRPQVALILNLHKDHDREEAMLPVFARFASQAMRAVLVSEDDNLASLARDALVFGFGPAAQFRAVRVKRGRTGSRFEVEGVTVEVPLPGQHNVSNALAAMAAAKVMGADLEAAARGIAGFAGVSRRFETVGVHEGIEVIDDYAHNPAKILAAMKAGVERSRRLMAVFQPHGFGPTRFMRRDYVEAAVTALRPQDRILLQEIYYAGGTVTKDISAADLCRDMKSRGVDAEFFPERAPLLAKLARDTRAGDTIMVMGARDPSLGLFARDVLAAVKTRSSDETL